MGNQIFPSLLRQPLALAITILLGSTLVDGFSLSSKSNVMVYWGQGPNQQSLASYCASSSVDVIGVSFLTTFFGSGGAPEVNFGNACGGAPFPGTNLLSCPQIGEDIKTCQAKGKVILLSLGGAFESTGFESDAQASSFADTLWQDFGAGSSKTRPFGDAIVDGFDLDIENNQPDHYPAMIKQLRSHFSGAGKTYYISSAPQCPFPDASLHEVLDYYMDMVFIQFYNNPPCNANNPSGFNFETWQNWVGTSGNPNAKLFLGVPGSSAAAGTGYQPAADVGPVIQKAKSYPNFGGVMIWDAVQSFTNIVGGVAFVDTMKKDLTSGGSGSSSSSTASKSTTLTGSTLKSSTSSSSKSKIASKSSAASSFVTSTSKTSQPASSSSNTAQSSKSSSAATPSSTSAVDKAKAMNAQFATIKPTDPCTSNTDGCVNKQFAQCVNGAWQILGCAQGLVCAAIPDLPSNSVVVICDTQEDIDGRLP